MIPYEELVMALASWRERQGLPRLHVDFLGAPRQHRIDAGSALGEDGGMDETNIIDLDDAVARSGAEAAMSWDQEPEALASTEYDALEDSGYGIDPYQGQHEQQYGDAYTTPAAQSGQYGHEDSYAQPDAYGQQSDAYGHDQQGQYGYDSGPAAAYDPSQYGQSGGYEDSDGVVDEPTSMTYSLQASGAQSSPNQAYPPGPTAGVVDEREESTVIGAMLAPSAPPAGPGYSLQGQQAPGAYDSGGGVPSEPVYDSLAAAAEYHAEQNYDADQGYGGGDVATQAYQPLAETDYGQSYDPDAYGQPYDSGAYGQPDAYGQPYDSGAYGQPDAYPPGESSENTYIAPSMGPAAAGGEPPPLEPPPEGDDDFLVNFDSPDEDP